jgi:hypothetical protein
MSASHNPGGPEEDFGIKFNYSAGEPAPEKITDKIYGETQTISTLSFGDVPDIDLAKVGRLPAAKPASLARPPAAQPQQEACPAAHAAPPPARGQGPGAALRLPTIPTFLATQPPPAPPPPAPPPPTHIPAPPQVGSHAFGSFTVEVVDPVDDYLVVLKSVFDFPMLKAFISRPDFSLVFDAMHAVTGPYANRILVQELGAPASSVKDGVPQPDFAGGWRWAEAWGWAAGARLGCRRMAGGACGCRGRAWDGLRVQRCAARSRPWPYPSGHTRPAAQPPRAWCSHPPTPSLPPPPPHTTPHISLPRPCRRRSP